MARKSPEEAAVNELDHSTVLGKRPGKQYRFVARNSIAYQRARARGYTTVKRDEGVEAPYLDANPGDGTIGDQGLVLMECDQATYDARRAQQVQENSGRLRRNATEYLEQRIRRGELTEKQAEAMLREGMVERRG